VGNDLNELAKLSVKDLEKHKGIGEAKAITIVSALDWAAAARKANPLSGTASPPPATRTRS
jgi:DNA repair protein RadC